MEKIFKFSKCSLLPTPSYSHLDISFQFLEFSHNLRLFQVDANFLSIDLKKKLLKKNYYFFPKLPLFET